jgi:hypothetical protein
MADFEPVRARLKQSASNKVVEGSVLYNFSVEQF